MPHTRLSLSPRLDRYRGKGPFHAVCLPGLVPDGPETFARQIRLLGAFGTVVAVSYPHHGFDLDIIIDAVAAELEEARRAGRQPVLIGLSVGGGIAIELLRRGLESGRPQTLGGIVLISPFTCTADLSPLLARLMQPIIDESRKQDGRPDLAQERGRQLFKALVTRATEQVAESRQAMRWLGPLAWFLPQGYIARCEQRIIDQINRTFDNIPPESAVERVLALTRLRGIVGLKGPLHEAPTLILWGSKERQTLDMDGPGTSRLCRPDLAYKIFSHVEVHWIYDRHGGEVPHASLLRHAHAFNVPLARWLRRIAKAHLGNPLQRGIKRLAALARVPGTK